MSELVKEKITCPHCHQESEIDTWSSINVDLNPELREKILNEELWSWACPKCGFKAYIPWGTLYHDMTHKFMIFFSFDSDDVKDKYQPFEIPDTLGLQKNYTIRAVYGIMNFKEKILMLEHWLNDLVIEYMKYMISHVSMPEIAEKGYHLYFGELNLDKTEVSEHGTIYFFYNDEEKQQMMSLCLAMDNYYEYCQSVKIDPRMNLNGNKCIDEEWIDQQLKLEK